MPKGGGVETDLNVIYTTIQVDNDKLNLIQKPRGESRNKALSSFLRKFRASSSRFKQHWPICHCQGDYPEFLPNSVEFVRKIYDLKLRVMCN